jgi:hypothetical protein
LDFFDVVGFFADEPHRAYQVNRSALEESAGVSPAGLSVGSVELVFGMHTIFAKDVAVAFDEDNIGSCRC